MKRRAAEPAPVPTVTRPAEPHDVSAVHVTTECELAFVGDVERLCVDLPDPHETDLPFARCSDHFAARSSML